MEPAPNVHATGLRTIRAAGVAGLVFSGLLTTALIIIRLNQVASDQGPSR